MNASTITAEPQSSAPRAAYPFTRLMAWNMRRELWENRSIVIAPFAAAGLLILTFAILAVKIMGDARNVGAQFGGDMNGDFPTNGLWISYALVAVPVIGISLFVAAAYCLGALQGERRDRSILFWKSLPVSDFTTVLSKAAIPMLLAPLITFLAAMVAQLVVFGMALGVFPLLAANAHFDWNGVPITSATLRPIMAGVPVGTLTLATLYGLLTTALWHAPVYAWLLLVGGWAKRMAVVWAIAPVAGLEIAERIIFGTTRLEAMLDDRLNGSLSRAFAPVVNNRLPDFTPGHFFAAPGLWAGLTVAALFLAAAMLLRRYRQPI